jgi:predicted N-acetyltransferase YhbS
MFREPALCLGLPVYLCAGFLFPLHLGWSGASYLTLAGYLALACALFTAADVINQRGFYRRWQEVCAQSVLTLLTISLPALSFAALDAGDNLVGTIQAWPVALTTPEGRRHPLIMVGPVAILPGRQGQGFGRALMAAQAAAIDPAAPLPQVLIGDAPYYGRFGFGEAPRGWSCPGPWDPARLLVRGALQAMLPHTGTLGPWLD